jgi:hypothetical protein
MWVGGTGLMSQNWTVLIRGGHKMWTNSWSNFLADFFFWGGGVDEQFFHFGVQKSQGPKVYGTQSP